jgi:hypothetical protein
MDSKVPLIAKQAQRSIWCTVVIVKHQKEMLKEKLHKQKMEILREAQE